MEYVITFVGFFVGIYLIYLATVVFNKKKMKNFNGTSQYKCVVSLGKLNENGINLKSLANSISLANSFIISITITFFLKSNFYFLIKILIAMLVMTFLLLISYKIIGIFYKKKEGK